MQMYNTNNQKSLHLEEREVHQLSSCQIVIHYFRHLSLQGLTAFDSSQYADTNRHTGSCLILRFCSVPACRVSVLWKKGLWLSGIFTNKR